MKDWPRSSRSGSRFGADGSDHLLESRIAANAGVQPVALAHFVNGADVRMIERSGRTRLAQQADSRGGVAEQIRWQQLDRHIAIQCLIVRSIDFAHPARADFFQDAVMAECFLRTEMLPHAA